MRMTFLGATEEVTGSMTLVEINGELGLVDCGLYQGDEETKEKNFLKLPFSPRDLKKIILTHAHLDHSGYLPRLVKKGFKGKIICTPATAALVKIILRDSASLNKDSPDPLYDREDVKHTLRLLQIEDWNKNFDFLGESAKFIPAGHILGASSFIIDGPKRVVFSGDLGRQDDFLMPAPPFCPPADVVVMESTYGGRLRSGNMQEDMKQFLERVKQQEKVGIIASFALARGQVLMPLIEELFNQYPNLRVPIFFDSPMMKEANLVYQRYRHLTKLPEQMHSALDKTESLDFLGQWKSLSKKNGPMIIIASSGMVSGGRIFRSLSNWQSDPNAVLFLVGYQGENTPGRGLLEGNRTIYDNEGNPINWLGEINFSEAFSSHADHDELIDWVKDSGAKHVFLIHGEADAKKALKESLKLIGLEATLPLRNETFEL